MDSTILKDSLLKIKGRLEKVEQDLKDQIADLNEKEEKWKKLDNDARVFLSNNKGKIVRLNISGKKFATTVETLLKLKDTLFYKILTSGEFDLSEEIFFDRSPRMFPYILDYLRYNKICYQRFSKHELNELKIEADYYEIGPISEFLEVKGTVFEFVKFEFSGPYSNAGTNKVEDLTDINLNTGICATSPGWIIVELNREFEFDRIEIAGFNGNMNVWAPSNGENAQILTSVDKINWKYVGCIPYGYGPKITSVTLIKSHAKYIKFQHNTYLGLGYLDIKF